MGIEYRSALDAFVRSDDKTPYQTDTTVRGKDRLPAKTLKNLSAQLAESMEELLTLHAQERAAEDRKIMIALVLCFAALFLFARWITTRMVGRPLGHTLDSVKLLASGDAITPVTGKERKDEIRDIANAVEQFRVSILENQRLTEEQQKTSDMRELAQKELAAIELERASAKEEELQR